MEPGRLRPRARASTPSTDASREIIKHFSQLPNLRAPLAKPVRLRRVVDGSWSSSIPCRAATPLVESGAQHMLVDDAITKPVAEPSMSHTAGDATVGLRPSFAEKLNRRIDSELRMLAKTGDQVSPADRLAVFRDVAHQLVPCFQYFGPLLSRVLGEYDAFIDTVRDVSKRCRELEASTETTVKDLRADLAAATKHRDELLAADEERRARVARVLEVDEPHILAERVADMQRKLATERASRGEMEQRLAKSAELSQSFQDALRTMQINYERMLDEKEGTATQLRLELDAAKEAGSAQKEAARRQVAQLEDEAAAGDIEIAALKMRVTMLLERIRNLEGRVAGGTARYSELQEAYGVLEDRLERLNKPTSAIVSRDPVMTPRPSKVEVVNRVPQLGTANNFHSTQGLIDSLLLTHEMVRDRALKAEDVGHASKAAVAESIAAYRKRILDDVRGVESSDAHTQVEPS